MSDQAYIRNIKKALDARRRDAQMELDKISVEYKYLRLQCDHPNAYTYSAMGELGRKCDDCGYQT